MKPLIKKELGAIFNSPAGVGVIVLFGVVASFLAVKDIFVVGSGSLRPFFALLPWVLMVVVPALSMRALSEERQSHTLEVLLSLPVSEEAIVIAKFLSLAATSAIALVLTSAVPVGLAFLIKLPLAETLLSYAGMYLFSLTAVSVTLFFSACFANQILVFLSAAFLLFFTMGFSLDLLSSFLPRSVQDILYPLSPLAHLPLFQKGVLDAGDCIYFAATIVLFLWYAVLSLKRRT